MIVVKEDIIKAYAAKRKALSEKDVADLYECTMRYFRECMADNSNEDFVFELPGLGKIFKRFEPTTTPSKRQINMVWDWCQSEDRVPVITKMPILKKRGIDIQEYEQHQNAFAEQV